jgi:hypothetical protein
VCQYELPIEKWNTKKYFEEGRKDDANILDKLNEYKSNNNILNNINKFNEKK